jgi:hypothetical protein
MSIGALSATSLKFAFDGGLEVTNCGCLAAARDCAGRHDQDA